LFFSKNSCFLRLIHTPENPACQHKKQNKKSTQNPIKAQNKTAAFGRLKSIYVTSTSDVDVLSA